MPISDPDILNALAEYLLRYPADTELLSEPLRLLSHGAGFADRRNFTMHVTAGALLVRDDAEILLIRHRAYDNMLLQPGGHLEPADASLMDAALRELTEETGVDPTEVFPASPVPVYVEYGLVPARPAKNEAAHYHLDFGFCFTTAGDVGRIQESEVTGAGWYPLTLAESLVGHRIARALPTNASQRSIPPTDST